MDSGTLSRCTSETDVGAPPLTPAVPRNEVGSVRSLLLSAFNDFQDERREMVLGEEEEHDDNGTNEKGHDELVRRHVDRIRKQLKNFFISAEEDGDGPDSKTAGREEEIVSTLQNLVDCALAATDASAVNVGSKGTVKNESPAFWILDLLAALLASHSPTSADDDENSDKDHGEPLTILLVLQHVVNYTTVLLERIRAASLFFLGSFARYYVNRNSNNKNIVPETSTSSVAVLDLLTSAIVARITDKSSKVRQAAVAAAGCGGLASKDRDVLTSLVYAAQHDPSTKTRALAVQNLPPSELSSVEAWVSRLRDENINVRVAAAHRLSLLPSQMWDAELRVSVVQAGLSQQRYVSKSWDKFSG